MIEINNLESILAYAKRGFHVFPCYEFIDSNCACKNPNCKAPGKHPRTSNGHLSATNDVSQITKWCKQFPNSNFGIRTGKISNIIVLDIDPRNGGSESFEELKSNYGVLPDTPLVHTGGGGEHYYLEYPNSELRIPSRSNLLRGIDIKADDGYVIAPPSSHKSGRSYVWDCDYHIEDIALAPTPSWLLKLLKPNSNAANNTSLELAHRFHKGIAEGARHNSILSVTGHLLRRYVDPLLVMNLILSLNETSCHPPLAEEEIIRIVQDLSKKELMQRKNRRIS